MSFNATISDSEGDDSSIEIIRTPEGTPSAGDPVAPQSVLSIRNRDASRKRSARSQGGDSAEDSIAVMVTAPSRPWEYQSYHADKVVDSILGTTKGPNGASWYRIEYESGKKDKLPLERLIQLKNGQSSLDTYKDLLSSNENENAMAARSKRVRNKPPSAGFVDSATAHLGSEDSEPEEQQNSKKRRFVKEQSLPTITTRPTTRSHGRTATNPTHVDKLMEEDSDDEIIKSAPKRPVRVSAGRASRSMARTSGKISQLIEDEGEASDRSATEDDGEIVYEAPKSKPTRATRSANPNTTQTIAKKGRPRLDQSSEEDVQPEASRRSGRDRGNFKSMREGNISDEIYAEDTVKSSTAKVHNVKEIFKDHAKKSPFRSIHNNTCDVCNGEGTDSNKGYSHLLYCQGCNTSLHRACIGNRTSREHVVTKVGEGDFVIQCRRCVGAASKKDPTAPLQGCCSACQKPGLSCGAFSKRLTPKQEEKLRLDNDGVDPITNVSPDLINNVSNVLFRCNSCYRAYHFEHLPSLYDESESEEDDDAKIRDTRIYQYRQSHGQCKECHQMTNENDKVDKLVAWKPIDGVDVNEEEEDSINTLREDQREYLVKWVDQSYLHCTWRSGAWVYGICAAAMRKAFARNQQGPVSTKEEAIPEDWLRIEIVLDVQWKGSFTPKSEAQAVKSMSKVDQVLVKFSELTYDDAVWDEPPEESDADRYSSYQAAFREYLRGVFFVNVSKSDMDSRLAKFRKLNFANDVAMEVQPDALTGGKLMKYQLEGANWMLYNFYQKKNVILADDMGLGKTIQVVTFLAALIKQKPKCWPFLIVTPNSTCPNWRSELKKWAPDLRVVAFYGAKSGRDKVKEYELFAQDTKTLTAHVVITSYEGPVDSNSASIFRSIAWVGLIVDEGQRLKNDENLLYKALTSLNTPFQVLLTGTPLQNNKRELFNLLHFLDPEHNAAELDKEYADVKKDNVEKLRNLIRPYFLRRTKGKVLNLPPLSQVILPVTMSFLQKKVSKLILSKNIDLIRSILGETQQKKLKPQERGNLNNILMQLRKVLSHPFLYSRAIEERTDDKALEFRNLVDASSKFQLLEIMLPKLKERNHRVLIFSQFLEQLDHIEDFLSGLKLNFSRLDGSMTALKKDKVINEYNAPGSEIFAMLLSTRAGGVGINLATADTVIIMDPDYNPHQDAQALSRAHRIGQKKPVVVFNLMTKNTAEEKIIQVGRKKLTLGVLIENMDEDDDDAGVDVETMLKHGAAALFNEEDGEDQDIRYDSAAVDKLLDRSQMPVNNGELDASKTGKSDEPGETFSFAKIWVNDKATLSDDIGDADEKAPQISESAWQQILEKRERDAKEEAERRAATEGRGKRDRVKLSYREDVKDVNDEESSPKKKTNKKKGRRSSDSNDGDFAIADNALEQGSDPEDADENDVDHEDVDNLKDTQTEAPSRGLASIGKVGTDQNQISAATFDRGQHAISGHPRLPGQTAPSTHRLESTVRNPLSSSSGHYGHQQIPSAGSSSSNGQYQFSSTGRDRSAYRPQPANGQPGQQFPGQHPTELAGPARSSVPRPDFMNQRSHSGNNSTPAHNTSLNHDRPSAPCHTCKLEHQDICRKCPRTMSNSKIRILLDGLEPFSGKAITLRNQLRWIIAARAEKKPVRT